MDRCHVHDVALICFSTVSYGAYASITVGSRHPTGEIRLRIPSIPMPFDSSPLQISNFPSRRPQTPFRSRTPAMARVAVILAVILSLFVLSHARLSPEPTTTSSSETSADADREPSETLDPTVHVFSINKIRDGSLPAGDVLRHIGFSLRRPIYHHRHHFRHFHGHRRHRMRAMEIALGADAIGLPGDRIPLRSSEEKGLVKEEREEEIKGEKPTEEEEEIEKREGDTDSDSDSDSDDDEEEKIEKMEKRKRKCKKNKKNHHLRRFHHHHHRRHEQDEAEKTGFMKRFWDFLNHF